MTRIISRLLLATAIATVLASGSARAQWAVFDSANYSQNLLESACAMQQINNQIRTAAKPGGNASEHGRAI